MRVILGTIDLYNLVEEVWVWFIPLKLFCVRIALCRKYYILFSICFDFSTFSLHQIHDLGSTTIVPCKNCF